MTLATEILPWLAAGALLGAAYLMLIARSVAAIGAGAGWRAIAVPVVLRLILAVAALGFAARHGALPVVLMLCGFVLVRTVVIRRMREG
jgi:hypothetical protein